MTKPQTDITGTPAATDYLDLSEKALLGQCDVNVHRSSGPGGQHRNKVSTAIRLHHRPTGITVQGYDSRSQLDNKRTALKRLRIKIACQLRRPVDPEKYAPPEVLRSCLFTPGKGPPRAGRRLQVGRKDRRFWPVAQCLLDLLAAHQGRLAAAAGALGITTSNLTSVLKDDRHLYVAAQAIRKSHGLGPLK